MGTIATRMSADHQRCDQRFADMEAAVNIANWDDAAAELEAFDESMRRHLDFEEQVLFPSLERSAALPPGPTEVMAMEHEEMRGLLDDMHQSLEEKDAAQFLGQSETLLILIAQHNHKEEQIVYAAADEMLEPGQRDDLLGQMEGWDL